MREMFRIFTKPFLFIFILLNVALSACGLGNLLGPTLTPTYTSTPVPSNTPTPTNTLTYTPTPTLSPTPTNTPAPTSTPTQTPIPTPAITMALYESAQYPFSIQYPSDWVEMPKGEDFTAAYADEYEGLLFAIVEEDLYERGMGEMTEEEYFAVNITNVESPLIPENLEFELISRQKFINKQGYPMAIDKYLLNVKGSVGIALNRLIYLHEGHIGFNAIYLTLNTENLNNLVEYSFSTFNVGLQTRRSAITPVGDIVKVNPGDWPDPDGTTLGNPEAKVVIEVFEDFKCIACKIYSDSVEPSIIANHVSKGEVYYVFYHYPFLDDSRAIKDSDQAAAASMCAAEQNKFWDFTKILFANFNSEPGEFNDNRLIAFAESLKLDMGEFEKCYKENRYKDQINENQSLGVKRGITGTPSVFINGGLITPGYVPTYLQIHKAIAQELAD